MLCGSGEVVDRYRNTTRRNESSSGGERERVWGASEEEQILVPRRWWTGWTTAMQLSQAAGASFLHNGLLFRLDPARGVHAAVRRGEIKVTSLGVLMQERIKVEVGEHILARRRIGEIHDGEVDLQAG